MNAQRACPITGEPLLNPGQTVSHAAMRRALAQTRGLATLMHQATLALAGHAGGDTAGTRTQPGSRPPLNLSLFQRIDDHRDTLNAWAYHLLTHVRPGARFRDGDWQQIEAIYQQLIPQTLNWVEAPAMVDEVLDAVHHIERALAPPATPQLNELERQTYLAGALMDQSLTITPAREAVRLLTGRELPASTIRSWKHRGTIRTKGDPPRYHIRTLIQTMQNERATPPSGKITDR